MAQWLPLILSGINLGLVLWLHGRGNTREDAARAERLALIAIQIETALPQLDAARTEQARHGVRLDGAEEEIARLRVRVHEVANRMMVLGLEASDEEPRRRR